MMTSGSTNAPQPRSPLARAISRSTTAATSRIYSSGECKGEMVGQSASVLGAGQGDEQVGHCRHQQDLYWAGVVAGSV